MALTIYLIPVAALALVLYLFSKKSSKYIYPPGPKGHFLFGNALELPSTYPGQKFAEWGQQYDNMFSVFMGQTRWVVVNSTATARNLLDRRGRLYSSRPQFPVTQDILSGGKRVVLMQYDERWRRLRKVMHQLLTAKQADTYKPYQDVESRKLVWDYLRKPEDYYIHGARFSNSVIMSVVFGKRTSMSEASTKALFGTIDDFLSLQLSPSTNLIHGFPFVAKWLPKPFQWYRPAAEKAFKRTVEVYQSFFEDLERRVDAGEDPQCFSRELVNLAKEYEFDLHQQYFCAGTIIEAGSDTTRNQLNILLAAAALFPAWVQKAQVELDKLCGKAGRLPEFSDYESLPYIVAVMKETLRWRPNLIPTGVPRVLVEDDSWGPYKFEKGTVFTWNQWGIAHRESEYKDNETFLPERFLDSPDLYDMLKGHLGFGMGRRVCVGWHVATRNMFISFSRLLYCFNFTEDPNEPIDPRRIDPLAHHAAPFKIRITPRSEAHVALIQRECRAAGEAVD